MRSPMKMKKKKTRKRRSEELDMCDSIVFWWFSMDLSLVHGTFLPLKVVYYLMVPSLSLTNILSDILQ